MDELLRVENLSFSYGKNKILDNLSFTIKRGEFVSVIGPSSCGKTTLLKLVAGVIPSNSILFGYGYFNKRNQEDLEKIGVVLADSFPFLFDTVYKELTFPLENLCLMPEEIEKRILEVTNYFELSYLLDKRLEDLKQEEKSLLRLLLSLIHKPELLVLDDPFFMMRRSTKEKMIGHLKEYCRKNKIAILLTSSSLEDILFCDTTYVLNGGIFVMKGDTLSVLEENDTTLKKMGLELPFMVSLSLMLIFYEILDKVYLNQKELVDVLWN